jgi:hypothetical protein
LLHLEEPHLRPALRVVGRHPNLLLHRDALLIKI